MYINNRHIGMGVLSRCACDGHLLFAIRRYNYNIIGRGFV